MKNRNWTGAGIALAAILAIAGCNRSSSPSPDSATQPPSEQPAPGEPGVTGSNPDTTQQPGTNPAAPWTHTRSTSSSARSTSGSSETQNEPIAVPPSNPSDTTTPPPPANQSSPGAWEPPSAATSTAPGPTQGTAVRSLPAGQTIEVVFLDDVSSAKNKTGDSFRARVASDVMANGAVAVPAGSVVVGTVTEAVPLNKHFGGQSKLAVNFDRLQLPSGQSVPIDATLAKQGKNETHKDVATVLGGAVAGAVAGRVLKGKQAARIGAVVGAAAGTAVAMTNKGAEVSIPSGTDMTLTLRSPADVPVPL